ncbi:MAG: flagellar hook protein FlgE [Rhodospirillaceae bacterium]
MSLYGAMFSGVSGLNAQSQALGMISDNISNVNTVGYKTSKASFSTLVTRQALSSFYAPGGVRSSPVSMIDRQGLLQASSSATDLAVSGAGFFVVTDTNAPTGTDSRSYTRAGQFITDSEGYLQTPSGYYLNGWVTDSTGTPTAVNTSVLSSLEPIRVNSVSGSATATTGIEIGANLPASAAVGDTETTNVQIFDSLGVAHDVTFTWTKMAANTWEASAAVTGVGTIEEAPVGSGTPFSVSVVFNPDGTPASFDGGATVPSLAISTLGSGAADQTLTLDFGTPNFADGLTQFSSTYSTAFVNQDGVQFGNFYGVNVDDDGIVTALYDNGETLKIYQIPLATFPNPNGLANGTGTVFTQTQESGNYFLRAPGEANAGTIAPSSLEASTSDLAHEFTNMIITQRAYAASTRIITTADEMLDELIRVKR